jgi:hypothetical protein
MNEIGMCLERLGGRSLRIAAMLFAVNALADEPQPRVEAPSSETQAQALPSERRAPAPVTPFTPTEKIKADSSVAFPVDI